MSQIVKIRQNCHFSKYELISYLLAISTKYQGTILYHLVPFQNNSIFSLSTPHRSLCIHFSQFPPKIYRVENHWWALPAGWLKVTFCPHMTFHIDLLSTVTDAVMMMIRIISYPTIELPLLLQLAEEPLLSCGMGADVSKSPLEEP